MNTGKSSEREVFFFRFIQPGLFRKKLILATAEWKWRRKGNFLP